MQRDRKEDPSQSKAKLLRREGTAGVCLVESSLCGHGEKQEGGHTDQAGLGWLQKGCDSACGRGLPNVLKRSGLVEVFESSHYREQTVGGADPREEGALV